MACRRGQQKAATLQALEEFSEYLMDYPNVVGVGLAEGEEDGESSGLYRVKVYVSKMPDPTRLPPEQRIPPSLAVRLPGDPNTIVSVPTTIEEIGEIELEAS